MRETTTSTVGKVTRLHGWHLTNYALHAINGVLVFAILSRFVEPIAAFLGALMFIAHPVGVPAVQPIAGRPSLLCAMFYFAALMMVLLGWMVPAIVLWYMALRSKEEAAIWPIAALVTWGLVR